MSASGAAHAYGEEKNSVINQVRSRFALVLSALVVVLPFIGMITQYTSNPDAFGPRTIVIALIISLSGLLSLYFIRRKQITAAGMLSTGVLTFAALFVLESDIRLVLSVLAVISASTLAARSLYYATLVLLAGAQILRVIGVISEVGLQRNPEAVGIITGMVIILTVGVVFRYFFDISLRTSQNAEDSYQRLTSIAAVGRQTSRILNYEELISQSVELIKQQFGFYHVQIFLVDDRRENAVLAASTGEAGRRLLGRNHKLGVGSQSVIGRTTLANEPVLINDTENEPGHAFNPLLPETRAELALPMQVQTEAGLRVMGALDVQSETPMAFSLTDVQALQALANQLAVAIRNAQLFETQEKSLQENETLFKQAQGSLEEIRRLNSQLTRQAWDGFIQEHAEVSGLQIEGETITFNAGWTPLMIEACQARDTITHKDDGVRMTATPMMLRDEVLGAVEVVGGDEDEINLIEAIVAFTERFAVALENVRLVEEAQAASAQEQRIGAVVSRFQEAETVDELLQITLTELADTLNADGGSIRVGLSASGQAAR